MTPDKVDDNQKEIVEALRKIPGIRVEVGHDDIFVGYAGKNYWFEIKNPDCVSPKTGKIRPSAIKPNQKRLLATWPGQYFIVWKLSQILKIVKK